MSNALAHMQGMQPQTMADAMEFAERIKNAPVVPKAMQNRPGDILAAMLYGYELGMQPMQSLQGIAVINGKPSLYGDSLLAVVLAHPQCEGVEEHFDHETKTAHCLVRRRGRAPVEQSFSDEDAERAGLFEKKGPWLQYPRRMLQMRARAFALRDAFADALRGMSCAEETQDYDVREVRNEPAQTAIGAAVQRQPPAAEIVEAEPEPREEGRGLLDDVINGFKKATDMNKLARAGDAGKLLTDKAEIAEAKAAYLTRRENLRKELGIDTKPPEVQKEAEPEPQQEPEQQNFAGVGPEPMDDIDPELFDADPATGRVE